MTELYARLSWPRLYCESLELTLYKERKLLKFNLHPFLGARVKEETGHLAEPSTWHTLRDDTR